MIYLDSSVLLELYLAGARALDAVHACTALLLQAWTGRSVRMATFDARLRRLSTEVNLS